MEHGYTDFGGNRSQLFASRQAVGGKQYAKQVVVTPTVYESERKVDFLVLNNEKWPDGLIIECKWQQVNGSVDEKYPFLYFNIMKSGVPTVILLDGGGCRAMAKKWLEDMVHPQKALIGVWDMAQFQRKVNDGFLS